MSSQVVSISRRKRGKKLAPGRVDAMDGGESPQTLNPLAELLLVKVNATGQTFRDLSRDLNVSYPYLMALLRGGSDGSDFCDARRPLLEKCAAYLGIPVAQAFVKAGALLPTDFFYPDRLPNEMDTLFRSLSGHKKWGGFCPTQKEWEVLQSNVQLLIGLLYQECVGQTILQSMTVETPSQADMDKMNGTHL